MCAKTGPADSPARAELARNPHCDRTTACIRKKGKKLTLI